MSRAGATGGKPRGSADTASLASVGLTAALGLVDDEFEDDPARHLALTSLKVSSGCAASVADASTALVAPPQAAPLQLQQKEIVGPAFSCMKCKLKWSVRDMSSRSNVCKLDNASYVALTERWKNQRQLRVWFTALSDDQKGVWFRAQHGVSAKRSWDVMMFTETSKRATYGDEHDLEKFVTWRKFKRRMFTENPGIKVERIAAKWIDIIQDPAVECLWRREQWLVPEYDGVVRQKGRRSEQAGEASRRCGIEGAQHLQNLESGSTLMLENYIKSLPDAATPVDDSAPHVEAHVSDQPTTQKPVDYVGKAILREVSILVLSVV